MPAFSRLALVLGALCVAAPAFAQSKIAYVDMQKALQDIEEAKVAKAKLKKQFDDKQKTLDAKQEELKGEGEMLEKRADTMNQEQRAEKLNALRQKAMDVGALYQKMQKELSDDERRLTQEIFGKMGTILRDMAGKQGYAMVLEKGEAGILWAPDDADITTEVVKRYNSAFPVKGGGSDAPKKEAPAKGEKK